MTSLFQRPVSATEWLYIACEPRFPPFCIQMVVELQGVLELDTLRAAVTLAARANPGSRLVLAEGAWREGSQDPPVRVLVAPDPWPADIATVPELQRRLDLVHGPTCELLLGSGRLVIRASHATMDAAGLLSFARDLFRVLRGESCSGRADLRTDDEVVDAGSRGRERRDFGHDARSPYGTDGGNQAGHSWRRLTVECPDPAPIARLAHALAGVSREAGASRHRFMIPVDLRRRRPDLRSVANLSRPVFLEWEGELSESGIYQQMLQRLQREEELERGAWDRLPSLLPLALTGGAIGRLTSWQLRHDRFLVTAVLSHLGRVSLSDFSTPTVRAERVFMLPLDTPASPLTLVSLESEAGLEITASMPRALASGGRLDRLLTRLTPGPRSPDRAGRPSTKPRWGNVVRWIDQAAGGSRCAVRLGAREMSHAGLLQRSRAIAGALRKRGVGRGDRVGLLMGPSLDLLPALVGILRTGAAFVPLDPREPAARLGGMAEDAGCRHVVTDRAGVARGAVVLPPGVILHCADTLADECRSGADLPALDPQDPAYVLYTSGSSGRPKGVVVAHRSLAAYVKWAARAYLQDLDRAPAFALFTSLGFDLTLTTIFLPMVTGGEIRLLSPGPTAVIAASRCPRTNVLKITPTHLRLLLESDLRASRLERLIVGGEALPSSLAAEVVRRSGGRIRIFNEYGPTETTVGCSAHLFDPSRDHGPTVPIGSPMDGATFRLFDPAGNAVSPPGHGELAIGGPGVALGYHERPDEEALRFVPDPGRPGERLFRTGDWIRWSEAGQLFFVGRTDDQVKIRGHRVEPGEVEAALRAIPGVQEVAALAGSGPQDEVELLTFVTLTPGTDPATLRPILAGRLPPWMLPARIIPLAELPRTAHDKIDRTALREQIPPPLSRSPPTVQLAASDPLIGELLRIASEILQLPAEALDPELPLTLQGADSMCLAMLLTRAGRGIPLELLDWSRGPSLSDLAAALRSRS